MDPTAEELLLDIREYLEVSPEFRTEHPEHAETIRLLEEARGFLQKHVKTARYARCALRGCNSPSRARSKYCSRICSNKNARRRHAARRRNR